MCILVEGALQPLGKSHLLLYNNVLHISECTLGRGHSRGVNSSMRIRDTEFHPVYASYTKDAHSRTENCILLVPALSSCGLASSPVALHEPETVL